MAVFWLLLFGSGKILFKFPLENGLTKNDKMNLDKEMGTPDAIMWLTFLKRVKNEIYICHCSPLPESKFRRMEEAEVGTWTDLCH